MLRKFLIPLLTFCAILPCAAQDYTADATLLRTEESYIVLECSGIARNKKEAVEMAKKSAIYTYLYIGINGFDKGRPLLGRNPSDEARAYADRILGTSSYANYIRNCTIDDNINKTAKRDVQVLAKIELYHVSLKRTLENAGVLKRSADEIELSETREAIAMPTAFPTPCPRGPLVTSTPGVTPNSGCPGVLEPIILKSATSFMEMSYPQMCSHEYKNMLPCPALRTKRSLLSQSGFFGS